MQRVRRGDVDEIDGGIGNQRPPVAGGVGEAERVRSICGHLVVDVGENIEHRDSGRSKTPAAAPKACEWLAHEAAADEADAELRFHASKILFTMRRIEPTGKEVG